jgi:sugar phosphate isomerase/epimerase
VGHARSLGSQRIGLLSTSLLAAGGREAVRAALAHGGPAVETINHPFAVYPSLDSNLIPARDLLLQLIDIAAEIGSRSIYLLTGGRGSLPWEAAAARFVEAIEPCRERAAAGGIRLMIENASMLYADIHICHSLGDTIRLAEMAQIGVCVEIFHCWGEASLEALLQRALPICNLVQVSDYVLGDRALPNRAVPGDGVIPLEKIIALLLDGGYSGAFDIELLGPRIDAEGHLVAARRGAERLSAILDGSRAADSA